MQILNVAFDLNVQSINIFESYAEFNNIEYFLKRLHSEYSSKT